MLEPDIFLRGDALEARSHRLRADRAEERAADLEDAIGEAVGALRDGFPEVATATLLRALACPLCGARAERECSGLDEGSQC